MFDTVAFDTDSGTVALGRCRPTQAVSSVMIQHHQHVIQKKIFWVSYNLNFLNANNLNSN